MTESPINTFRAGVEIASGTQGADEAPEAQHPELEANMKKLQSTLEGKVEEVRNDKSLDNGARVRAISSIWGRAQEVRQDTENEYRALLEDRVESAQHRLFYTAPAERDSVRAAYSEVQSRVDLAYTSGDMAGIEYGREQLEEMFERARRTGDRALEKAVGHYALEKGSSPIRDRFVSGSKDRNKAWEDYNFWGRRLQNFNDPQERAW